MEMDLSTKIGLRLRAARNAQKLPLSALAARTGGALSRSRISNYEQGLRRANACVEMNVVELSDQFRRERGDSRVTSECGRHRANDRIFRIEVVRQLGEPSGIAQ